jgi:hypothetical protein
LKVKAEVFHCLSKEVVGRGEREAGHFSVDNQRRSIVVLIAGGVNYGHDICQSLAIISSTGKKHPAIVHRMSGSAAVEMETYLQWHHPA